MCGHGLKWCFELNANIRMLTLRMMVFSMYNVLVTWTVQLRLVFDQMMVLDDKLKGELYQFYTSKSGYTFLGHGEFP